MDENILIKMAELEEDFFHTKDDPTQADTTLECSHQLLRLHPSAIKGIIKDGEPISWVITMPTSRELAERFLKDEITEHELLDVTEPRDVYDALYLLIAFTVPEHRGNRYTAGLFEQAIREIPHTSDTLFVSWPFSEGGKKVLERVEKDLGISISLKKHE
jgi:hypothetical protein